MAKSQTWDALLLDLLEKDGVSADLLGKVRIALDYAVLFCRFDRMLPFAELGDVTIDKVTITPGKADRPGEVLMVVRGHKGKGAKREPLVAFHSGPATPDLMHTWLHRVWAGDIAWRVDTPYSPSDPRDAPEPLEKLPGMF